jgi:archaemetzincin
LAAALCVVVSGSALWLAAEHAKSEEAVAPLRAAAARLESLHLKKKPPGPNDWLATHPEPGQTFDQYRRSHPSVPTRRRTTLYVQPVGKFSPAQKKLVGDTAEILSCYYSLPAKVLEPLPLDVIPAKARRDDLGHPQILTGYVLDHVLKPRRPTDAVAVLALTTADLWPGEGWNFVFGEASLSGRVGVWSIYRYGNLEGKPAESQRARLRAFKVAVHETGHMLGMAHCTAYECQLNGGNNLPEVDASPLWLCPDCLQKAWWACHADPIKRFLALIEFGKRHGLTAEVEFWQKSVDRLRDAEPAPPTR